MKYLCRVYADEKRITALSDGEREDLVAENPELCEDLRKSGHFRERRAARLRRDGRHRAHA